MQLSDKNINTYAVPSLNMQQIHAEDDVNDASGKLQRMTVNVPTNLNMQNSGTWFQLPNGDRVWKLRVESQGAMAINFLFNEWTFAEGAQLHIYNEAHTDLLGAFTHLNNKSYNQMSIQHVLGDVAILEFYEPASVAGQTQMNIEAIGHAYRQIYRAPNQIVEGELRGSDPCEVDVNCSEGNAWTDQINGACRIYVVSGGGAGWCSGTLINNTALDCKPYILTALHCGENSTASNFNQYIFYFNYQSANCGSGAAPTNQTLSGCDKIADSNDGGGTSGSDYLLVEADATNASTTLQGYNAYWNGWNANNSGSPSGVSVHHPAGDRKKISTYSQTLTTTQWGSGTGSHWLVDWVGTANGHGVTEGGSSGSPIFDNNGRVVGQLTGGSSYCTQVPNTSPDLYGKMSYNWTSNNAGDHLEDYLDPGNTGAMTMDGTYYPCTATTPDDAGIQSIDSPNGTACGSTFTPQVTLRNYGSATLTSVIINYQLDATAAQTLPWTGSLAQGATTTVTLPALTTTSGAHTLDVWTTLPNGTTDGNAGNDQQTANFNVNTTGVQVDFTLVTDCWGSEITWEVQDAGGTTILSGGPYTDVTGGETITETWCLSDGCYDFIINDTYGDGMYGSQYGSCTVDGDYTIVDNASGTTLASIIAANSDFGNSETNNFCITSTLASNFTANNTTVCAGTPVNFTDQSGGGPVAWSWSFPGGAPTSSSQQNPTVTYNTPGTYDVTLQVTGGGGGTDSNTQSGYITVVSNPSGSVSSSDETCAGDCDGSVSATISGGTTPYSYAWSGGIGSGATVNNVCSGTYNLVVTDDNGCTVSGLSATVAAGLAAPTANFTASATTVFLSQGGTVNFTDASTGAGAWSWDFGDGGSATQQNPSHTYTAVGTYTVTLTVTNANGCSDTFTMQINVDESDGISEAELNNAINLFPNPTDGLLSVTIDVDKADEIRVEVYNAIGELISTTNADNQRNVQLDLSTEARGLYYVTVFVDEVRVTRKVSLAK